MRNKTLCLVFTFPTTTEAMRMESKCRHTNTPGRIIPVPGQISAGCGLAWRAEPVFRQQIEQLVKEQSIELEAVTEILI